MIEGGKMFSNICQSCGMPMDEETQSKFDERYCIYCQDQTTKRLKPYEEVVRGSVNAAVKFLGKSKEEAIKMANENLPKLPRWKKDVPL
jgi:hypothetical protein